MKDRVYSTLTGAGALNITVGIISLVTGLVTGILLIANGRKLPSRRDKICVLSRLNRE